MDMFRPKIRYENRSNAPKHAPCPRCGTPGARKQKLHRTVRSLAYQTILLVRVTTAEYRARCSCSRTFRTQVDGIEPKAQYANRVREAVLDRLLEDHMSLDRILTALRRDFLLDLSTGFVYDCLRWKVRQLDLADYRRWTLQEFSGTLGIDEIHLGRFTLVLATDPIKDFPVAFALVSRNDQGHMRRFLGHLRDHGFQPQVVVTDGSSLYPAALAAVWPKVEHQLCIFHVMQDLNRCVLDAVCRLRKQLARRGGKGKRHRGRPRKEQVAQHRRRRTLKQKAQFVFRHRHLLVKRRTAFSAQERKDLVTLLEYLPALAVPRRFVDQVQQLFSRAQTPEQAQRRFQQLRDDPAFAADADLTRALAQLTPEKFPKIVAFLRSPLGQRVRTNNHVERMNRKLRHYEKVRYRWRRAAAIVRFVALVVDRGWHVHEPTLGPQLFTPAGHAEGRSSTAKSTDLSGTPVSPREVANAA
jgi:transposase-like protein